MKRTLAVLLSLLMISFSASADGVLTVLWNADSGLFGEYLSACGFSEKSAALVSEVAGTVFRHLSGNATVTDDAGRFLLRYDQNELLNVDWKRSDAGYLLHSSLIPGMQFLFPDLDSIFPGSQNMTMDSLLEKLQRLPEPTEEKGRFWGFAYSRGDRRLTYHFKQRQMVDLLRSLLDSVHISEFEQVKDLLARETDAASEDRYSFQLSVVSEKGALTGISATLKDFGEPVAALSIGYSRDGDLQVIFGTGLQSAVYYCELKCTYDESEQVWNGSLDLYSDPYGLGFEAVHSYGMPLGNMVFNGHSVESEAGKEYHLEILLEQQGRSVLSQHITCRMHHGDFEIKNASYVPESEISFFETDIAYKNMAVSFEPYAGDTDEIISVYDLSEAMDRVSSAAGRGMQGILLKLGTLIPELLKMYMSQ